MNPNRARTVGRAWRIGAFVVVTLTVIVLLGMKWWYGPLPGMRAELDDLGFDQHLERVGEEDAYYDPFDRMLSSSYVNWTYAVPDSMSDKDVLGLVTDRLLAAGCTVGDVYDDAYNDGEEPYRDYDAQCSDRTIDIQLFTNRPRQLHVGAGS
jgi:hypothetical protein